MTGRPFILICSVLWFALAGCTPPARPPADRASLPDPALRRAEALGTETTAAPARPSRLVVATRQPSAPPPKTAPAAPAAPLPLAATTVATPTLAEGNSGSIYFTAASDRMEPGSRRRLQEIAERLKGRRRAEVTLIGHSEDKGSSEFGVALAQRRVDAVADALEGLGVPARKIRRISYGNEAAAAECLTEDCRQQLRRVDIRINGEG